MKIKSAEFVISNTDYTKCPVTKEPEYAFIGRSNVGKSSLINMLTDRTKLAKTSGKPGKTQLINHFHINKEWYLVDLPGYGWAQVSKKLKEEWSVMIKQYLLQRENLVNIFVLIDSRIPPQKIDLEFIQWVGENGLPISIIFTKADKTGNRKIITNIANFKNTLKKTWDQLPPSFVSSSAQKIGQDEILGYIDQINSKL
ncbi:ribosome biogenesis GTP-binding protein YihA/YsxC [Gilvimarinus agarilyticus]|uniref:Probable GTP-binding protein EngB n=1 Tax=Reichenbachiella agariperforans TaxID=156994 RepID=A0A1M6MYZ1_REIAG|nr:MULTISPECIES: ribosome biogenesis GTP-binding protein YihA/YsxC [Reichenbachiella]MBU2888006.1 ribosome biogenesis GTP-binding protein YihA/YsxC [Gilvimarinus agarilyticus]MBU2915643.1 ribosome biogenesis GTP-binding protein YihA/YsxC [Reichenbachiella agariperforans]RJE72081.1 YihA family ribosome biogenesis GTP-binding protein [Reichenbachiella sp. MSK19-1]SHJ88640.1 GTP-binding protein [Reichenbachiella agariperforans]